MLAKNLTTKKAYSIKSLIKSSGHQGEYTLQFPETGSFEYKVVNEDGKIQAKGVIIVE